MVGRPDRKVLKMGRRNAKQHRKDKQEAKKANAGLASVQHIQHLAAFNSILDNLGEPKTDYFPSFPDPPRQFTIQFNPPRDYVAEWAHIAREWLWKMRVAEAPKRTHGQQGVAVGYTVMVPHVHGVSDVDLSLYVDGYEFGSLVDMPFVMSGDVKFVERYSLAERIEYLYAAMVAALFDAYNYNIDRIVTRPRKSA